MKKKFASNQGIVASDKLNTIFQREIFFPVDPIKLDWFDQAELQELSPSGFYVELNLTPFLELLPELEAEIFWLIYEKKKHQKDIAKMLGLSQPTVSYRYRRVLVKLRYLMTLKGLPLREKINEIHFLKEYEKLILYDLFFYLNQEKVGKKHGVTQSTVKWIYSKTKKRMEKLEKSEPDKWFNHCALLFFLEHHFNIRVAT